MPGGSAAIHTGARPTFAAWCAARNTSRHGRAKPDATAPKQSFFDVQLKEECLSRYHATLLLLTRLNGTGRPDQCCRARFNRNATFIRSAPLQSAFAQALRDSDQRTMRRALTHRDMISCAVPRARSITSAGPILLQR